MLRSPVLTTMAATALTGFTLAAAVLMQVDPSHAGEPASTATRDPLSHPLLGEPDLKARLDDNDEVAALEALRIALSEVADGSTFVWHRRNGRMSGIFQPTTSFKDADGKVCRHLKITLTSGPVSRATEGIACREASGVWNLEG